MSNVLAAVTEEISQVNDRLFVALVSIPEELMLACDYMKCFRKLDQFHVAVIGGSVAVAYAPSKLPVELGS